MNWFFVCFISAYVAMMLAVIACYFIFAARGIVNKYNGVKTESPEDESMVFTLSLNMALTFGIMIGLVLMAQYFGINVPMDNSPQATRVTFLLIGISAALSMPIVMMVTKLTIRAMYRNVRFRHLLSARPVSIGPQRRFY